MARGLFACPLPPSLPMVQIAQQTVSLFKTQCPCCAIFIFNTHTHFIRQQVYSLIIKPLSCKLKRRVELELSPAWN